MLLWLCYHASIDISLKDFPSWRLCLVRQYASMFTCRLSLISIPSIRLCCFHYAKISVDTSHTFKIMDDLVLLPANDQGNYTALMSNALVILSPDRTKVVGSLRKTNYAGNKWGNRGCIFILKEKYQYIFKLMLHSLSMKEIL